VSPPHVFCKFCYCLISNGAEIWRFKYEWCLFQEMS
jgi:hypothetical protein